MAKFKYTTEYEFNVASSTLFPYLHTSEGLEKWFAEKVEGKNGSDDKLYNLIWDGEEHRAKVVAFKPNHYVKFQFAPQTEKDKKDPSYLDFRLEHNALTNSIFLKIVDYSEMNNLSELKELWDTLAENLRASLFH